MLVKLKEQSTLTATPLNNNNTITRAYISRGGLDQAFKVGSDSIELNLYDFDTINNVVIEVASTSTVTHNITDASSGTYVVTAEDGSIKTYGYNIVTQSYTNGLPVVIYAQSDDGSARILKQVDGVSILGTVWNIGEIAKRGTNQINSVDVQFGGWSILSNVGDFDGTERQQLYNGVDSYLKVWRTIDAGTTNYYKFVYYRIVTNSALFPTPIIPTPAKLGYANKIGYLNFDVFVPLKKDTNVEQIYNKEDRNALINYLSPLGIEYYTPNTYADVDTTFIANPIRDLSWNENFDKGFKIEDVISMSKTFGIKLQEIIKRDFEIAWDLEKGSKIYASVELEIIDKVQFRYKWLKANNIDSIYEWSDYLTRGLDGILEDMIQGLPKDEYLRQLKDAFRFQFTYAYMVKYFNENDINFFKLRFEYLLSVLSSYKSDLSSDDVIGMINVFTTLESVIRVNKMNGQTASTINMNVSIEKLVNKSEVMYLTNPFL